MRYRRDETRNGVQGFTLIELVSAVVIVGVIVAVAVPVFRDVRYDARRATLEAVSTAIVADMNLARTAYLAQSLGPGSTLQLNGQSIEVFGVDVVMGGLAVPLVGVYYTVYPAAAAYASGG